METSDAERKMVLDAAWDDLRHCFGLGGVKADRHEVSGTTVAALRHYGIAEKAVAHIQSVVVEKRLRENIVPLFWSHFVEPGSLDSEEAKCDRFGAAVSRLHADYLELRQLVVKMSSLGCECRLYGETSYLGLFNLFLKGTLHSQMPANFEVLVEAFYGRSFQIFCARQEEDQARRERARIRLDDSAEIEDDDEGSALECSGCRREKESCHCSRYLAQFAQMNSLLMSMDLLERLTSNCLTRIVHVRIDRHVQDTCKGSFTISHLESLEEWLDAVVMGFMKMLYAQPATPGDDTRVVLESFRRRLLNYLYETYTTTRIDQLYNIIIEFPESQPALEDIRECLEKTNLRSFLTVVLQSVLQKKLLHLGVSTTDILTAYISAIKSLRVLDPSGVILQKVCEPVRRYLRTREDTVRCIVQSLIDDSSSELADELSKNEGLLLEESFEDDEEKMTNWETWTPDPVDADPQKTSSSRRTADIISMLVNIYGSKELFVNEYRSLLSNRLLSHFSYETDKEIRNLELLKLRFGEAPLHQCEVMLKDISDSKRINTNLHSAKEEFSSASDGPGEENDENIQKPVSANAMANQAYKELARAPFPVNGIILSAQFWPPFKEDTLQLPQEVVAAMGVYTKAFEAMKGNRTLVWKNNLGFANVDLEVGDKKINLTVSPVHAAIIYQFQLQSEWAADDLAHSLSIPVSTLRRKITFWQSQGLVREVATDRFKLIEEGPMRRLSGGATCEVADADDESESVTRTAKDQRNEELQVFWSYISNMLINFESLPLDRIYKMLRMFAMPGGAGGAEGGSGHGGAGECDIEEVRAFLDRKVRAHELVFSGGQYRLPK